CAARAGRRHLVQARHLAELPLERRGDRRGDDVGARAGIERDDLDRRVVDLGQRRRRQHPVGDDPREQHRDHQQRGRDRPQDEQTRRVHPPPLRPPPPFRPSRPSPPPLRGASPAGGAARPATSTLAPSRSLSAPSVTTTSPGLTPSSIATSSACEGPTRTARTLTVLSALTT